MGRTALVEYLAKPDVISALQLLAEIIPSAVSGNVSAGIPEAFTAQGIPVFVQLKWREQVEGEQYIPP